MEPVEEGSSGSRRIEKRKGRNRDDDNKDEDEEEEDGGHEAGSVSNTSEGISRSYAKWLLAEE